MENCTNYTMDEGNNFLLGEGILLISAVVLSGVVIIIENTLMIVLFLRSRDLLGSEMTTFLLLNVSVTDLLVGVANISLNLYFSLTVISLHFQHHVNNFAVCLSVYVVNFVSVATSSCFLLMATIDRYVGISYPFLYLRVCTMRRTYYVAAVTWVLATCSGLILLFWNNWDYDKGCKGVNILPFPFLAAATVLDCSLMTLMIALNVRVYFVAQSQARRIGDQTNCAAPTRNRKAVKFIATVTTAYVLFCLPLTLNYLVLVVYQLAGLDDTSADNGIHYTVTVRTVNSAVTPIISFVTIPAVRKESRKLFGKQS